MNADDSPRPSWLREPCPTWCRVTHHETDLPDDRVHESAATAVSVTTPADPGAELYVTITRAVGATEAWVFIGGASRDGQHLHLSPESARRVARALLEVDES
ncbi:hypothetical protein [Aeromicrobium sp. Leaf350]|uniref:DUF6907 domain-containing protein n=1 Tax=Aeromicrobium sp. Leaf350 TaxID=2876565 RepID=UPI001E3021A0|nr:hypothetical protein [Aeromicrobium sp. Leaf350]